MRIKEYLSFSQYRTFLISEREYIKIYFEGHTRESKYLDFGKKIAEGLENRAKTTDDIDVKTARGLITAPQCPEKEIDVLWGKVPLKIKMDGFTEIQKPKLITHIIEEYKTGKNAWTQTKVDKEEQITFYVAGVCAYFKVKPEQLKLRLSYLPTYEDTDGQMHLTGECKIFETHRTSQDLLKFYPKIEKVWYGIEELIKSYI